MLQNISQVDFATKEAKYHGRWCAKYKTEGKSIFRSKNSKTPIDASSTHSEIYYEDIKKEKSTEAFDAICNFIEGKITVMLRINRVHPDVLFRKPHNWR